MEITVVVGTFGDESWAELARSRAIPSAESQSLRPEVIHVNGETLHDARNQGAADAAGRWLCFLDADDALAPGYLEAMAKGVHELRAPAVQYVHPGYEAAPVTLEDRDIRWMNPCVIGTLVPKKLFCDLGGFRDWPVYEDYDLWLRCWRAGATIQHIPDAIYRAWVRDGSRNEPDRVVKQQTYAAIRRQFV